MKQGNIIVNAAFTIGRIDSKLYGSFLEHMGRTIYTGIYEPSHVNADEDGFRTDVLKAVHDMGVTVIRYPGGNFVSGYEWRDGIGPKEKRPRRLELAWGAIENNEFGTDEFMHWAHKAGVQPMLAVNLGTNGTDAALSYIEYCNHRGGTDYSDLRKSNGASEPYGVKLWCLGNEMDGTWQIGHKSAEEYGRLTAETAKAMKLVDPSIEVSGCGSSLVSMPSFPDWDMTILNNAYEYMEYLALHQYFAGQEKGFTAFVAQSMDMDRYLDAAIATCDFVKARKRSTKTMYISVDEWGIWTKNELPVQREKWHELNAFSEQVYSLEDSLLFAGMLMSMIRHADRVKMACQSLLTNISAPIMTEQGGGIWYQPIFYVFSLFAHHAHGSVLRQQVVDSPVFFDTPCNAIPLLDSVVIYDENCKEVIVFCINRDENEEIQLTVSLEGFSSCTLLEHIVLYHEDYHADNRYNHQNVVPQKTNRARVTDVTLVCSLQRHSFNMIRLRTGGIAL